jgi:hypothetical protein
MRTWRRKNKHEKNSEEQYLYVTHSCLFRLRTGIECFFFSRGATTGADPGLLLVQSV